MRHLGRSNTTLREPPIATDWEGFVDNFITTDWETPPITLPKESYTTDWEGVAPCTATSNYDRLGDPLCAAIATDWEGTGNHSGVMLRHDTEKGRRVVMAKPKAIGRTMKAAHQLRLAGKGELAMAVELIDVHTPKNQELSLLARRCLLLMLEAAAGDAWVPEPHCISKKDLRGNHRAMDRIRPAFEELMSVWFSHGDTLGGKKSTRMFHLLETINDQDDESGSAFVEFQFTERARQMLERSEVYARLSKEAIIKFQSRYSLRMYEIGAAIYGKRDPTWTGEVAELRKLLQVPKDTYPNFSDFRKRVLEPARGEIEQLAEFSFTWEEFTIGRQVKRICMTFTPKPSRQALAAAEENSRHSVGRGARRTGTAEKIVGIADITAKFAAQLTVSDLRWPHDDDINDYQDDRIELYRIGREGGGGHAVARLSAAYVQHMGDKRFELTGERLRSSWKGFVESKAATWKSVG